MNLTNQEILADMLINARTEKRFSQRHLSLLTGVSHTEISKLEKAERLKPQPTILKKLADVLDIDYEDMLEAVGYIDTPDFDDNRYMLDENEKSFIVNAIIEKYQSSGQNLKFKYDKPDEVYNLVFKNREAQESEIAIPPDLSKIIKDIVKKSDGKQIKKFIGLCKWFILSEFDE